MLDKKTRIVIYGVGKEGEKFYDRYCDYLSLDFVIDRDINLFFHDIPVKSLDSVKKGLFEKYYVIVTCRSLIYSQIRIQLEDIGGREYLNFCPHSVFYDTEIKDFYQIVETVKSYSEKLYVYPALPKFYTYELDIKLLNA